MALVFLALLLLVAIAGLPFWSDGGQPKIGGLLATSPIPVLSGRSPDSLILVVATSLFLVTTANGIVGAVLLSAVSSSDLEVSQDRLRGGRYIGPLERLLIFAIMMSGDPTAAAIVVAAKSIVRFPEISRSSSDGEPGGADHVTEYFLLGSLTSWSIAIVPTLLFVR